jgi:iron complex outermembrane receptor protein
VQPLYTCDAAGDCRPALNPDGSHMIATQSTASNGYGGISSSVDASQHNSAVYVDLEADVLRNLTLGIAGRYEDYSSFGSTTQGKFSARLRVTDWLALRGTFSSGFHAPTPGQSNVQTLSTTFVPGTANQVQIGTYPVTSAIAQFYGAVPLKPEKSKNASAGIVLTPVERMLLTIDGYRIKVTDRIGISQQFTVTEADIAQLPALRYIGAGGTVQYFTNGFDTDTRGLDVVGTYPFQLGPGLLSTTLAYNYNKTTVPNYNPTVISQSRIIDIMHYAPNNRVNIGLEYRVGPFAARLQQNYYGTWRDENDYPGQLFGAKWTTDLDLSYRVWKDITLAIGGRNITNTYPDRIANSPASKVFSNTGGLVDGQVYPRTGGPFGFNGAFYYVRFDAKF